MTRGDMASWRRRHIARHKRRFGLVHYVRARLHRRLFVAMGAAIFGSLVLSIFVSLWWGGRRTDFDSDKIEALVGAQFAAVWNNPDARRQLLERAAAAFLVTLSLDDLSGIRLADAGGRCERPHHTLTIRSPNEAPLGQLHICFSKGRGPHGPWLIAPVVFAVFLWMASGFIAHRLGRPLGKLVEVTREIGAGKLSSRARLGRHETGELGVLAESINDMATRIEQQMADQKELLAAVSHEMRTPLTRLSVVGELFEEAGASQQLTAEMKREIAELDDLIGQLLANSRMDFQTLDAAAHDPIELGRVALRRVGLAETLLVVDDDYAKDADRIWGDATLLIRALINLLNNAQVHGAGVTALAVRKIKQDMTEFSVEDRGPGLNERDLPHVFQKFYRGNSGGGQKQSSGTVALGLGLSLVRRIAQCHGGDADAVNVEGGGVRVRFWVRSERSQAISPEHDALA